MLLLRHNSKIIKPRLAYRQIKNICNLILNHTYIDLYKQYWMQTPKSIKNAFPINSVGKR